jgi:hypothetical protein
MEAHSGPMTVVALDGAGSGAHNGYGRYGAHNPAVCYRLDCNFCATKLQKNYKQINGFEG